MDIIQLIQEFMRVDNPVELTDCYERWIKYIKMQFENKNRLPHKKYIYTHLTCAVSTMNMQKVFCDVQHIVVECILSRDGYM